MNPIQKFGNRQFLQTLVSILMTLSLGCAATAVTRRTAPGAVNLTPAATPPPARTVGESSLGLEEIWRFHTGGHNSWRSCCPHLYVKSDKVFISYAADNKYGDRNLDSILIALSVKTGKIIWRTYIEAPEYGTDIVSSHIDEDRLYLIYSFRVNAFSLETGKLLWSTRDPERPGGHTTYRFRPWDPDDPLLVHSSADEVLAIDPRSGEILYRQAEEGPLIQWKNIAFVEEIKGLYAIDKESDKVLWERQSEQTASYPYQINPWPGFVGDDILFATGAPCFGIKRVNLQTGHTVWQTQGSYLLSNFAIENSRLYALRKDLTLIAFDLDNGTIIGTLTFNGPLADLDCDLGGSGGIYWVVVDGSHVLVYFSDTQELVALKRRDP
jgi:outer membrane protein assembly factor BamB